MTLFTIMGPLFDVADNGGSGGGSGDGSTAAGSSSGSQAGAQGTQGTQATGAGSTGQQGTQASGSTDGQARTGATSGNGGQQFDPKDFIPRHRFNEISTQNRTLQEQVQDLNRRLTIALGGEPHDPETAKAEAIKAAFFKLPGMGALRRLAELDEQQLEQLLTVPQAMHSTRAAEAQQWERHGNQVIDNISGRVAEAIGAESLSDDQKSDLRENFSGWLKGQVRAELQQAAERYGVEAVQADERRFSPTLRSYEDGSPKLLDAFVTRYTKNWVEPARRSATARTSTRTRPTPDGSGRSQVSQVTRPEKFNSLDDRLDFASKLMKERGLFSR